jgi:putative transposase
VTLAHEGAAAFRDRYELIHRHRATAPNALWQADHTLGLFARTLELVH